jgi:hypothetical protein
MQTSKAKARDAELQLLGCGILALLKDLDEKAWITDTDITIPSRRRVSFEGERFRLWARNLGLTQSGHASLDYRVRDASVIKTSLANLLGDVKQNLEDRKSPYSAAPCPGPGRGCKHLPSHVVARK